MANAKIPVSEAPFQVPRRLAEMNFARVTLLYFTAAHCFSLSTTRQLKEEDPFRDTETAFGNMSIRSITATGRTLQAAAAVDSPVAVVRELLDNALDAGSTQIAIAVDSPTGGLSYISVSDNGNGILEEDHHLVFAPASSSKAPGSRDLGFRGEALHLICRLTEGCQCTTRTASDATAFQWEPTVASSPTAPAVTNFPPRIVFPTARMRAPVKRVAAPVGTTVVVKGLFHNTPARRKMLLKKPPKEFINAIELLIKHYAILQAPRVRFIFNLVTKSAGYREIGTTQRFATPPVTNLTALLSLWSQHDTFTTLSSSSDAPCHANISITAPASFLSSASLMGLQSIISVNGRLLAGASATGILIKRELSSKLSNIHGAPPKNFPWMVKIDVPHQDVDANIEPKKDDVYLVHLESIILQFDQLLDDYLKLASPGSYCTPDPHFGIRASCIDSGLACSLTDTITPERSIILPVAHERPSFPKLKQCSDDVSQRPDSEELTASDKSWSHFMHDKLSSDDDSEGYLTPPSPSVNTSLSRNTTITSYNYNEDEQDDELGLSKSITVSNPFTLMVMRPDHEVSSTKNHPLDQTHQPPHVISTPCSATLADANQSMLVPASRVKFRNKPRRKRIPSRVMKPSLGSTTPRVSKIPLIATPTLIPTPSPVRSVSTHVKRQSVLPLCTSTRAEAVLQHSKEKEATHPRADDEPLRVCQVVVPVDPNFSPFGAEDETEGIIDRECVELIIHQFVDNKMKGWRIGENWNVAIY